jgi:O-antigen ligase
LLLLCTFPALLFAACPGLATSHRWGAGIATLGMLTAQLLGMLPGAWLGTFAGLVYLSVVRRYAVGGFVLLAGAIVLVLGPPTLRQTAGEMLDPASPPSLDRLEIWRNAAGLFAERPLTGWGLGDLRDEYARVKAPGQPIEGHMHSVPVNVAVSMGIPGLLALAWLTIALFRALARARRPTTGFLRRVVDSAEASLVAFLAAGLVEWNLGDSELLAMVCFLVGVAVAAGRLAPVAAAEAARGREPFRVPRSRDIAEEAA